MSLNGSLMSSRASTRRTPFLPDPHADRVTRALWSLKQDTKNSAVRPRELGLQSFWNGDTLAMPLIPLRGQGKRADFGSDTDCP